VPSASTKLCRPLSHVRVDAAEVSLLARATCLVPCSLQALPCKCNQMHTPPLAYKKELRSCETLYFLHDFGAGFSQDRCGFLSTCNMYQFLGTTGSTIFSSCSWGFQSGESSRSFVTCSQANLCVVVEVWLSSWKNVTGKVI
jgi:hypothetical protein